MNNFVLISGSTFTSRIRILAAFNFPAFAWGKARYVRFDVNGRIRKVIL